MTVGTSHYPQRSKEQQIPTEGMHIHIQYMESMSNQFQLISKKSVTNSLNQISLKVDRLKILESKFQLFQ